jgi:alpha-beta hydrolase superfamily lysophospholipase
MSRCRARRHPARKLSVALPLSLAAVLLLVAPTPSQADFYSYPRHRAIAHARDGRVFDVERMEVAPGLRSVSAKAARIMYRSQGLGKKPVAVTGFLITPRGQTPENGWPVVAWAHGTSGVGPQCAPSRWPDLYPPPTYDGYEVLVKRLLEDGYAVVGTDYAGLGFPGRLHPYLQIGPETRALVDGVRAARRVSPDIGRRWFGVGHSQGGGAVLGAAAASRRAPRLHFLGSASIAPGSHLGMAVDDLGKVTPPFTGQKAYTPSYASYIATSARLFSHQIEYTDLLSPQLAGQIPAAKQLCLDSLAFHFATHDPPLKRVINPNWRTHPELRRFFRRTNPARKPADGPILLLQGDEDHVVAPKLTDRLDRRLCRLGDVVKYRVYAHADHDTILSDSYPALQRWLGRLARGKAAPRTCSSRSPRSDSG